MLQGDKHKVGDGNLRTEAEAGASIFTGITQVAVDSMINKYNKNDKKE